MKFEFPLLSGTLVKRYKRFLADVDTSSGLLTIHCPNTGSMRGCATPGNKIWFWDSKNPKRKYRHSWELVETDNGHMIGINTGRANHLIREAIESHVFSGLDYDHIQSEVRYGNENSRIDLLLTHGAKKIWIEVKSVTLLDTVKGTQQLGYFPDAITSRGTKHLRELMQQVRNGDRAILIYCVQHSAIKSVQAAQHIDPLYAATLQQAVQVGVEVIAAETSISTTEIKVVGQLPVHLSTQIVPTFKQHLADKP